MEFKFIKYKLLVFHRLMRIDKPIGTLLLLWPTLWGLWFATPGFPPLQILIVFLVEVWLMRSAGCVFNDYIDRKFDGYVKRTALRPLPRKEVSRKEVYALFIVLISFAFLLVLALNTLTIKFSVLVLALTCAYPFMKRYIYLPQVVLGITFSLSIPMAFIAIKQSLPISCWVTFFANILWTVAYDTQYAMVDRDDDLKIGIKSTAILFGHKNRLIIGILQVMVLALMVVLARINKLNRVFYCSVLIAGLLFAFQQKLMAEGKPKDYFRAFMNNNYIGLVLFLGIAISYYFTKNIYL